MEPNLPVSCLDGYLNNTSFLAMDYTLADTGTVVAGVIIFLLILPLVLFEFPFFPLGTTSAVLLGAVLMVCTTVLSQGDAYKHLGEAGNMRTIALLLGMMLLAQYFEREKIINRLISRMLKEDIHFASYLWRVCLATSLTSAFITNDAACVVLTPLWLEHWKSQKRPQIELDTLLLAIATSANIGSSATIFGNPQMALIASKTSEAHFKESRLDLLRCIMFLGVPTIIGTLFNVCFLIVHWKIQSRHSNKERGKVSAGGGTTIAVEMISDDEIWSDRPNDSTNTSDIHIKQLHESKYKSRSTPQHQSESHLDPAEPKPDSMNQRTYQASLPDLGKNIPEKLFLEKESMRDSSSFENIHLSNNRKPEDANNIPDYSGSGSTLSLKYKSGKSLRDDAQSMDNVKTGSMTPFISTGLQTSKELGLNGSVQNIAIPAVPASEQICFKTENDQEGDIEMQASGSKVFRISLWISLFILIILLFVDTDEVHFDMGLLPMATAAFVMMLDAAWNRRNALYIIRSVDWSVLVMFFGLFVWMAGLNATRIPRWIWKNMGLASSRFTNFTSLAILCVFVVICSNIFSNVPLTIIVLEQLQPCTNQLSLVLYLAWCSTIAGNLTLFGSVANLIVAQKSKSSLGYQFSYWTYLKYGFVTTFVIVIIGMVILNGILQLV